MSVCAHHKTNRIPFESNSFQFHFFASARTNRTNSRCTKGIMWLNVICVIALIKCYQFDKWNICNSTMCSSVPCVGVCMHVLPTHFGHSSAWRLLCTIAWMMVQNSAHASFSSKCKSIEMFTCIHKRFIWLVWMWDGDHIWNTAFAKISQWIWHIDEFYWFQMGFVPRCFRSLYFVVFV